MSEQEKKSGASVAGGSSVVMVEQSGGSRHKQPYRPTELQEEGPPDLHHKRSRAPAVPSVAEELKQLPGGNITTENIETRDKKGDERKILASQSSDKHKHNISKKLSSNVKRRDMSPETITLAPLEVETLKQSSMVSSQQPIPAHVGSLASAVPGVTSEKISAEKKSDNDSISDEIAELRTPEVDKKHDWSDVEEAGGLPRSESRASRVSRAMRQLLCCGVRYEAPSEDNISHRGFASGI